MDHGALPATLNYRGYTKSVLHLDQPRRLPRHSRRQAAARGRHRQHRRHLHPRRLARRFQPHVSGRRDQARRRAAARGHLRMPDARHRRRQAGRAHRRHRRGDPDLCRGRALLGGARLLRPRRRPLFHDAPNILHYGRADEGAGDAAGHDLHHRADDQSRPAACEGAVRRLDGGDPRPLAVGPVRAHRRRHRRRLRDLHAVAGRARPARASPAERIAARSA